MPWKSYKYNLLLKYIDFFAVIFSIVCSHFIWNYFQNRYPNVFGKQLIVGYFEILIVVISSILWVVIFNFSTAYSYQRFTSIETELTKIIKTSFVNLLGIIGLIFIFRINYVPRSLIFILFIVMALIMFFEKILLFYIAKSLRKRGKDRKNILIVGTGKRAEKLIDTIHQNDGWGLDISGIISAESKINAYQFMRHKILGSIKQLRNILHSYIISEVIITISTKSFNQIRKIISICEEEGVQIRINSDFFGSLNKRLKIDYIYDIPIISIMQTPNEEFSLFVKRFFDIFGSSMIILIFSPLYLMIAILVKLSSKGPIFYNWNVIGLDKKPFKSWKFRTMIQNADDIKDKLMIKNEMKGPVFKIKNDPRITPIGKFLRKFSLDELPQLFSVLKGDMSLVGPRPVFPNELKKYKNWHRRKLSIKPGMTCLWQVSGRNQINDFDEWAKLDLEYIDNWSIWLDFKILFKTIFAVFSGRGAS